MNKVTFSFLFLISIYFQGNSLKSIYIEKLSDTALTKEQVLSGISLTSPNPVNTINMSQFKIKYYAYAVIRDQYGNFVGFADSASAWWQSFDTNKMTAVSTSFKQYECVLTRKRAFSWGLDTIIVMDPTLGKNADVLIIQMGYDGCLIRLIDSDKNTPIDTIKCMIGDSIILKTQGTPHDFPTSWQTWNAFWSLTADSNQFSYKIPTGKDSLWICKPVLPGNETLLISLGGYMDKSIPVTITPKTSTTSNNYSHTWRKSLSYCQGKLRIAIDTKDIKCVKIVSLTGQVLNRFPVNSNIIHLNLSKGVYFAQTLPNNTIFKLTVD